MYNFLIFKQHTCIIKKRVLLNNLINLFKSECLKRWRGSSWRFRLRRQLFFCFNYRVLLRGYVLMNRNLISLFILKHILRCLVYKHFFLLYRLLLILLGLIFWGSIYWLSFSNIFNHIWLWCQFLKVYLLLFTWLFLCNNRFSNIAINLFLNILI